MTTPLSRTAEIRAVARDDLQQAQAMLQALLCDLFDLPVEGLKINLDKYSLNSLNGFFSASGKDYFFKFHQEEGEEAMRGEYYRADILASAGLPVDQPVYMSTLPGEQVLVYARRSDPRFSDLLYELDGSQDKDAIQRAVEAEADLNRRLLATAKDSLHPITPAQSRAEPIHRLFHERLIDPASGTYPGGRFKHFYVGKRFAFPNEMGLDWQVLSSARPVINGLEYHRSLGELFDLAHRRYQPERLADAGGIIAHGDAHNANVWYERGVASDRLAFFDPAFAGRDVPSLLAEVKSTFHNVFAHPLWLYSADLTKERFSASVRHESGKLFIETDWALSPVREQMLTVKAEIFWKPWLAHLKAQGLLPEDWEDVIRIGLFLSPTLVMNLNAGQGADLHNPISSAIGFAVALSAGSRPVSGKDAFSSFFDSIMPD
ncbi:hypothetical protein [Cohaesibacter celericrescens]|uniref:Aminoglycoside phosphotransferase domain-containing protein n=1 Tax=Cohaesibacter celericrescens TaxID=2067669 RepID=A0A2N5XRV8_9HYPH|nr:hypothetical protein [Cohaesibacter celericrescens]PLW77224.1 hypothetical protein C0081_10785 [Cohaesibacter celericrescens]